MEKALSAMPVEQRAQQALVAMGAPTIEALIAKMETFKPVSEAEITDKDTFTPAWESLKEVRAIRKDIETTGKNARADATAYGKAVIAAEKELVSVIDPVEFNLKEKTDAWKAAEEECKAAKRERLQRIERAIAEITAIPGTLLNATSLEIQLAHDELKLRDIKSEGSFGEFIQKALEEQSKALEAMQMAFSRAVVAEEQARQLAEMQAQQAEFERQKAEFAEQQRQAELAKQAAENARLKAEKDKAEAEAKALREAEAKRQHEEDLRIVAEVEERAEKLEAERQAALAPDKDKLMKYAADLLAFAGTNVPALQSKEANELFAAVVGNLNKIAVQLQARASAL